MNLNNGDNQQSLFVTSW